MNIKDAITALTEAQSVTAANASIQTATNPTEVGVVSLPSDFQVHDLEQYLPERRRARGTMATAYVESFASYVTTHAEDGCTVFVQDTIKAKAVLNLGSTDTPGHADNIALLEPTKTAAYTALLAIHGRKLTQRDAAEFLEDWIDHVKCFSGDDHETPSNLITARSAVGALRNLTIESARKLQSEVKSLSASMSAFESVEAKSEQPIPEYIYFKCNPYADLAEREFVLRLGVITDEKPQVVLRIRQLEKHTEEMAAELAELVTSSVGDSATVVLGNYQRA